MVDVRRAKSDEIDEVADVLGDAFTDYPWTRWTVAADDHAARVRGLQRLALELTVAASAGFWGRPFVEGPDNRPQNATGSWAAGFWGRFVVQHPDVRPRIAAGVRGAVRLGWPR